MEPKNKQTTEQIYYLNLNGIMLSTDNRAHVLDDQFKEMIESIKSKGVFQAIVVRKINPEHQKGKNKDKLYEMIAGERRYRASQAAGKDTIPSRIIEATDDEASEIRLMENIHRKDLHPLQETGAFMDYLKHEGHDKDILAKKIGKSRQYIDDRLRLNKLVPEIQKEFLSGFLKYTHAHYLCRLQDQDQKAAFKDIAFDRWSNKKKDEPDSPARLKDWIKNKIDLDLSKAPFSKKDDKLVPEAGACINCPKNTGCDGQLFPELTNKSFCTDSVCYNLKLNMFIQNKVKEIKEKLKVEPVLISAEYNNQTYNGKKILGYDNYKNTGSKNTCAKTQLAIIVDARSYDKEKIGEMIYICTERKCNKHWKGSTSSGSSSSSLSAADKKKREKQRIENKYRQVLLREISSKSFEDFTKNKVFDTPPTIHLKIAAKRLWDRTESNEQMEFCKWFGFEGLTKDRSKNNNIVNASIDNSSKASGILQFMLCLSLFHETEMNQWGQNKYQNMINMAKLYKINTKAMQKSIEKASDDKKKQPETKKATTPKKKSKSKTTKKAA